MFGNSASHSSALAVVVGAYAGVDLHQVNLLSNREVRGKENGRPFRRPPYAAVSASPWLVIRLQKAHRRMPLQRMHMRMHMYIIISIIALLSFFMVLSPFPVCWVYDSSHPARCQVRKLYLHCISVCCYMCKENRSQTRSYPVCPFQRADLRSTSSASLRAEAAAIRSAAGTSSGGNSS